MTDDPHCPECGCPVSKHDGDSVPKTGRAIEAPCDSCGGECRIVPGSAFYDALITQTANAMALEERELNARHISMILDALDCWEAAGCPTVSAPLQGHALRADQIASLKELLWEADKASVTTQAGSWALFDRHAKRGGDSH